MMNKSVVAGLVLSAALTASSAFADGPTLTFLTEKCKAPPRGVSCLVITNSETLGMLYDRSRNYGISFEDFLKQNNLPPNYTEDMILGPYTVVLAGELSA